MIWPFRARDPEQDQLIYNLTFRLLTGTGKLQAHSDQELLRLLGELRLAGASDTVVDADGQLVSFDPGGAYPTSVALLEATSRTATPSSAATADPLRIPSLTSSCSSGCSAKASSPMKRLIVKPMPHSSAVPRS